MPLALVEEIMHCVIKFFVLLCVHAAVVIHFQILSWLCQVPESLYDAAGERAAGPTQPACRQRTQKPAQVFDVSRRPPGSEDVCGTED